MQSLLGQQWCSGIGNKHQKSENATKNQAHKHKVSSFQATSARRINCDQSNWNGEHVGGHTDESGQRGNLDKVKTTNHGLVTMLDARGSEVIRVYSPYRLLWNRHTDSRSYGILFTATPPLSPPRQYMSGCRRKNGDVAHTGLKTQCEPARHLSKYDDAPKYGRTFQKLGILRAGRAYGNPKI
jgi:hypothetical protein